LIHKELKIGELDDIKTVAAIVEKTVVRGYTDWDNHTEIVRIIVAQMTFCNTLFLRGVFAECLLPTEQIGPIIDTLISSRELEYTHGSAMRIPRSKRDSLRAELHAVLADNPQSEPEPELQSTSFELKTLLSQLPDGASKNYAEEAELCCRAKAYRAAIVMSWNFTADHFVNWILSDASRLKAFNDRWTDQWLSKRDGIKKPAVSTRDDFYSIGESELIETSKSAKLLSKDDYNLLIEALRKRNPAAHPSEGRTFNASITAGHISGLVDFVLRHK